MSVDMRIIELMEGARNLLRGVNISKDQNVLITYVPGSQRGEEVDPLVIQALMLALEQAKAKSFLLFSRPYDFDKTPSIVKHALYNCNTVISFGGVRYRQRTTFKALFDYGITLVNLVANTYNLLTSEWAKFPAELIFMINKKCLSMIKPGSKFHCVDPLGIDITGKLNPYDHCDIPPLKFEWGFGGTHVSWPGLTWGTHPVGDVNGVIVAHYTHEFMLDEPIKMTVEDHWITKVEGGGPYGKEIKRKMSTYKDGNYLAEIMWGLNPKAPMKVPMARSRRAGTLHFGWGQSFTLGGPTVSEGYHEDVDILEPTLTIDDKLLIDKGKLTLLEDPEIIEAAKKYGDPNKILKMYPG